MPRQELNVEIQRPPDDVFRFVEDPANDHIWRPSMEEAAHTSSGPVGVGTTGHEVYRMLGRSIASTWEITVYEPGRRVEYHSTSGPVSYQGSWSYESIEGGTRLTVMVDWEVTDWGVFGRLAERLLERTAFNLTERELSTLKRLLEA